MEGGEAADYDEEQFAEFLPDDEGLPLPLPHSARRDGRPSAASKAKRKQQPAGVRVVASRYMSAANRTPEQRAAQPRAEAKSSLRKIAKEQRAVTTSSSHHPNMSAAQMRRASQLPQHLLKTPAAHSANDESFRGRESMLPGGRTVRQHKAGRDLLLGLATPSLAREDGGRQSLVTPYAHRHAAPVQPVATVSTSKAAPEENKKDPSAIIKKRSKDKLKKKKSEKPSGDVPDRSLASWNQEIALLGSQLLQWSYANARAQTVWQRQQEAAERKILAAAAEVKRIQDEVLLQEHQLNRDRYIYELDQHVTAEYERLTSLESVLDEAMRHHAELSAAVEQAGLRLPLSQASADTLALSQQLKSMNAVLRDVDRMSATQFPLAAELGAIWDELGRETAGLAEDLGRCQEQLEEFSELEAYEHSLRCHVVRLNNPVTLPGIDLVH